MAFPRDGEATFWQMVKARVNRWSCGIALPNYPARVGDAEMRLLADFVHVVRVGASSRRFFEVTQLRSRITTKGLDVLWGPKRARKFVPARRYAERFRPGAPRQYGRLARSQSVRSITRSRRCRYLARLRRLQRLSLSGSNVSDADCAYLASLTSLTNLDLAFTGVSASGIKRLATLTNLTILNLEGTKVGDEAIPYIQAL